MRSFPLFAATSLALLLACPAEDPQPAEDEGTGAASSDSTGGNGTTDVPSDEGTDTSDGGVVDTGDTANTDDTGDTADTGASESTTADGPPQVVIDTTLGTIVIELYEEESPITVENFVTYVEGGFYDGVDGNGATIFHRVIPGFVIQGGGLTEDLETKATLPPIVNESDNGVQNLRGTLSMARLPDPDTATSQFFVNLVDNPNLDATNGADGYAVFAEVVEGMDVVDAIAAVMTTDMLPYEDVPVDAIIMTSVTLQ